MAAALVVSLASPASAAPARYNQYFGFVNTGPKLIPMVDSDWIPQGLTKDLEDRLVISYYDPHTSNYAPSRLAVISRATGTQLKWFRLDVGGPGGHVGGIATTQNYLWIANDGLLRRYSRSLLSSAADGATLTANATFSNVAASSYAFGQGETVWVGSFGSLDSGGSAVPRQTMYQYDVSSGSPRFVRSVVTPPRVQGVAITPSGKVIWSTSCGDADSHLIAGPVSRNWDGSTSYYTDTVAPPRSEGMVIAGGELQIVYETASTWYPTDADLRVRTIHHGAGLLQT